MRLFEELAELRILQEPFHARSEVEVAIGKFAFTSFAERDERGHVTRHGQRHGIRHHHVVLAAAALQACGPARHG